MSYDSKVTCSIVLTILLSKKESVTKIRMKKDTSLKFLAGVVWVMLVFVDEMQGQQQTMGLVESAKSVQDLAHIAVVDALSPLQTALSLLESQVRSI